MAPALGTRQGESLALRWEHLNERTRTLKIRKALQRQTWQHGGTDPRQCGEKYHKVNPCPPNCKKHARTFPSPCPPGCPGHARMRPQRKGGGLGEVGVKSKARGRTIGLPDQLFELLT